MSTRPPDADGGLLGRRPPSTRVAAALAGVSGPAAGPPPVPTHIVVAGHDFRVGPEAFPEDFIDFSAMARRRAEHLLDATPGRRARVIWMDAPSGCVTVLERDKSSRLPPVVSQDFGRLADRERYLQGAVPPDDVRDPIVPTPPRRRTLKDDQFDLLSVLDVLDLVHWLGGSSPGVLGELSFFCHGEPQGPQLFHSRNRRGHWMGGPPWLSEAEMHPLAGSRRTPSEFPPHTPPDPLPAGTRPPTELFNPFLPARPNPLSDADWAVYERDPCDRDGRSEYDFGPAHMPPDQADTFRMAFGPNGVVRYWGGCVSTLDFDLLLSTRLASGYRLHGLALHDRLVVTPRLRSTGAWAQLRLQEQRVAAPDPRQFDVPFVAWEMLLRRRLRPSYAAQTAQVFDVPVVAPLPGLWAHPEPGNGGWMHVPAERIAMGLVELATTHLGLDPDPELRGYVTFRMGALR